MSRFPLLFLFLFAACAQGTEGTASKETPPISAPDRASGDQPRGGPPGNGEETDDDCTDESLDELIAWLRSQSDFYRQLAHAEAQAAESQTSALGDAAVSSLAQDYVFLTGTIVCGALSLGNTFVAEGALTTNLGMTLHVAKYKFVWTAFRTASGVGSILETNRLLARISTMYDQFGGEIGKAECVERPPCDDISEVRTMVDWYLSQVQIGRNSIATQSEANQKSIEDNAGFISSIFKGYVVDQIAEQVAANTALSALHSDTAEFLIQLADDLEKTKAPTCGDD